MKRILIIVALIALGIGIAQWLSKTVFSSKIPKTTVATVLTPGKSLGKFSLDGTHGQTFTEQSFLGHWTVMFFGYASCPKICPQALALISEVWRSFPEQKPHPQAQFVFVTLNPEKDTVEKLKTFLPQFHPEFIGLTGQHDEIARLSKASGVFSWTDPATDGTDSPTVIDHSATILIISPEGRLKALFSPPHDAVAIAKDINVLMNG